MSEILLKQNSDGLWEEYKPFCSIDCMTEEDYNTLKEAVELYESIKHPKTNHDYIRSLTVEKFADIIASGCDSGDINNWEDCIEIQKTILMDIPYSVQSENDLRGCIIKWLCMERKIDEV